MQSKRYFSRPIEDAPQTPSWFSLSKTHQPYHAIFALILAYFLLTYITSLRHRAIDTILLRSFPAWSEKYTHLRLHTSQNVSIPATLALTLAVATRILPWVVLGMVPWYAGLEMGIVLVVWVFEQFLLWSWRLGKGVGWVPEGEEGWVRLSGQGVKPAERATGEPNGETPTPPDNDNPRPHTQSPSWLPQRLNFLASSFRGTRVQTSAGWETYQSITAEKKYQAKSFEELRNEQYEQENAREEQSFFGKSVSFLGDSMSFFRRRGSASSEEFSDAKSEGGGEEMPVPVPDLLTGSPRRMFT
ncbi:hypothetical protein PRZ48_007628 [Zasmidium cellare]|uniref:Uncharacterized protein n=1 Tax=Zasmidium cellare TaxID=395010 RepID=A0ABR0EJT9_ZASCE|nr:hypothetical protein PRZ48_007628 [Zasmidium cellare]